MEPVTTSHFPATPLPLHSHPATPGPAGLGVSVFLSTHDGGLLLRYTLQGDLSALRVPEPAPRPGPTDGLWQHTCLEAFVGQPHQRAYREFNFSPSGQWAAYRFAAERVRDLAAEAAGEPESLRIHATRDPAGLVLQAWLPAHALPADAPGQPLHWGLSAVIEAADGTLSYWALHHPQPRPDFHHPAGRTLVLARPDFI